MYIYVNKYIKSSKNNFNLQKKKTKGKKNAKCQNKHGRIIKSKKKKTCTSVHFHLLLLRRLQQEVFGRIPPKCSFFRQNKGTHINNWLSLQNQVHEFNSYNLISPLPNSEGTWNKNK